MDNVQNFGIHETLLIDAKVILCGGETSRYMDKVPYDIFHYEKINLLSLQ
jgi:hypothetical protein